MPCYKPLTGYQADNGQVRFASSSAGWNGSKYKPTDANREIKVPCGRCIGCRADNAQAWAARICHEASMHEDNCFITLTYNPEYLPSTGSLVKAHFQNFMKRLRKEIYPKKVRYYHCGEYGDKNNRPHYHAILFGFNFHDWIYLHDTDAGNPIYTSPTLERIWGMGFVTIGEVTYESAAYCARYVLKKINGKMADEINPETDLRHYERFDSYTGEIVPVIPEYSTMSRRPGIAHNWIDSYTSDVFPKDFTTIRGKRIKPPKYYDKYLKEIDPDMYDQIKEGRKLRGFESSDNTADRLSQREKVAQAEYRQKERKL